MSPQQVVCPVIVGGVDTHKDMHVAAAVDEQDQVLETATFPATRHGYKAMLTRMRNFGEVTRVGIECSGTYGAGLMRYLQQANITTWEVTSPDKSVRRKRGKDDNIDAENAAHAAFAGIRTVTPEARDGMVEALRVLKVCRKTAVAARRVALQMIQTQIVSAPEGLREQLRAMTRMQLIRTFASSRPDLGGYRDVVMAYRIALKSLARRYVELHDEIADLDIMIKAIVDELAPDLVSRTAIGYESAAQMLITAGDNPERLGSEASFAALCGVNPIPASSGKVQRHRLNRGGPIVRYISLQSVGLGWT
ncbi:Transposase [Marinobacterium lutimaris]|uniref:Transposase n=1 Tax=Marinobacterium lutimaris TaxID=568106 RepID=A0A1H6DRR0_9GAMM|nr:Transposase [Marinobacterium lutimaris]